MTKTTLGGWRIRVFSRQYSPDQQGRLRATRDILNLIKVSKNLRPKPLRGNIRQLPNGKWKLRILIGSTEEDYWAALMTI